MNNNQKTDLDIRLGNEKLEVKIWTKYLGIYIDSKLTWEKEIQIANSKLHKGGGIIRTMRHFLQEKQHKLLFSAFNSPYLDYVAIAWAGAAKIQTNTAKPLYKYFKILTLELNIKLLLVKSIKKLIFKENNMWQLSIELSPILQQFWSDKTNSTLF